MAQGTGRAFQDTVMDAMSLYPSLLRYGGGYWSEVIGSTSGQLADVLDAMIRLGQRPDQGREILTELMQRSREYAVSLGSTFERALLDFNQALVELGRAYAPAPPPTPGGDRPLNEDPLTVLFRELADFAASEALTLQSGQGRPDLDALRSRLESCVAELRRRQGGGA